MPAPGVSCATTIQQMHVYDVAIVGAGPAGSAAARLLASWQHRVVLLHRPAGAASTLAESIPPSCRKLFAACGVADVIEQAGFYRSTGNTVWWGSGEPRREFFADGVYGFQVDRGVLDDLMREQARAAGAELRQALVRDVQVERVGARVRFESDELHARFVLDCSGRAGVVARRGWRREFPAQPRTVALVGVWTSASGWPGIDPTHTLVESYEDGWAWSVPLSPQLRYVTAMVDTQRTQLARQRPAGDVYRLELGKARHLAALLEESVLERGPWGSDASVYAAHTCAADPLLLVGDAASFIDPLSSYGVKKALASAWLAAVAVHTSLRTPGMSQAALSFFAAREADMAASLLWQSRAQFEGAATEHSHMFWTDRAAEIDLPGASEPDARALRDDDRVQRAFAWLRAQPGVRLRAGASSRREPHPIVRGQEIVMEERLVGDGCPGGLRFLRDVDLVGLLSIASDHDEVPAMYDAYNRRFPPVALPDFLGALSVMIAFDLVEDSRASAG